MLKGTLESKMNKPSDVLKIFEKYTPEVEGEIKALLSEQNDIFMYDMMSYFFGFLDENMKYIDSYGGKRFRPGVCMLLAEFYGASDKALEVATAVEIFHNFTLIHDDIADKDEIRRNRPTVWKKWGINQALNTGDGQLVLVYKELDRYIRKYPEMTSQLLGLINQKFLQVIEGQHLDFLLSELPLDNTKINEKSTLDMMGRKSGILVGLPAVLAGIVAGKEKSEQDILWDYGFNLGVTYQFCDDIVSIWGDKDNSGKDELADIREKKKTFPIIHLFNNATPADKERLILLYSKEEDLTLKEIREVKKMLNVTGSYAYTIGRAKESLQNIRQSISKLSLTNEQKATLEDINNALFTVLKEDAK